MACAGTRRTELKLDLGCGYRLPPGFFGVDVVPLDKLFPGLKPPEYEGNFLQFDLFDFPWPWEDSSIDEVSMNYFCEYIPHDLPGEDHKDGFYIFFEELYRIMKPYGKVTITHHIGEASLWYPAMRRQLVWNTWLHLSKQYRDETTVEDSTCDFIITSSQVVPGINQDAQQVILDTVK